MEASSRAARGFESPRTRSSRRAGLRGSITRITLVAAAAAAAAAAAGGGLGSSSFSRFVLVFARLLRLRLLSQPTRDTAQTAAGRPRRNPGRRRPERWNWSQQLMRWRCRPPRRPALRLVRRRCRPRQAASSVPSETSFQNLSPPAVQRASSKFIPTYPWLPASALNNSLQSTESGFGSEPSPSRERPDGGLRLPPGPRPSPGQGLRPLVLGTTSTSSSHGGTGRRCQLVHHNNSRPFGSLRKCAWVAY